VVMQEMLVARYDWLAENVVERMALRGADSGEHYVAFHPLAMTLNHEPRLI